MPISKELIKNAWESFVYMKMAWEEIQQEYIKENGNPKYHIGGQLLFCGDKYKITGNRVGRTGHIVYDAENEETEIQIVWDTDLKKLITE